MSSGAFLVLCSAGSQKLLGDYSSDKKNKINTFTYFSSSNKKTKIKKAEILLKKHVCLCSQRNMSDFDGHNTLIQHVNQMTWINQ